MRLLTRIIDILLLCALLDVCVSFKDISPLRIRLAKIRSADDEAPILLPRPTIISPTNGANNLNIEKFLMMYTCKKCDGRNAQLVSKLAYKEGIVISTCKTCKVTHFIADNLKKLDMSEYGSKIDEYLESKGERVQRISLTPEEVENNFLIDKDGELTLRPKIGGQVRYFYLLYFVFTRKTIA